MTPSDNNKLEGYVDRVVEGIIVGWAWQTDQPHAYAAVDIFIDNEYVQRVPATGYRADLEAAGKGDGSHAFVARIPWQFLDGRTHSVRVCFAETTHELVGSPTFYSVSHAAAPIQPDDWVSALPNTGDPFEGRLPVRLLAVLGTWMEADIVAATVRHALTQGCERAYLVDNGSPDETVTIAIDAGAILAKSFHTKVYDENLRLQYMNDVARDVSEAEGDESIWWLFLDADEFHHGPRGMTLRDYLRTLDERFRVVGARCFDHYPSPTGDEVQNAHPLDSQPLCQETKVSMCALGHRKHPLQRFDKSRPPIRCGPGFHVAFCTERLFEPTEPVFLHHFPFRGETETRRRLAALWQPSHGGEVRAVASRDTHMLARARSLDAVYSARWTDVHNFMALDPMGIARDVKPAATGVTPLPWSELVPYEDQHVLRSQPASVAWNYDGEPFTYGDDVSYRKAAAFLNGHGVIEDWGCGFAHARRFLSTNAYVGLDASSPYTDVRVDLAAYRSTADCILMRHVLEHNADWRSILANALASFRKRMALILFTPFADMTRQISTSTALTSLPVPDIAFKKEDLTIYFARFHYDEESVVTKTQYGSEHIFYIENRPRAMRGAARAAVLDDSLRSELDAWTEAGIRAMLWWRDDDAIRDAVKLRRLLGVARDLGFSPALAVIPGRAERSLINLVLTEGSCVWQHGWKHDFHSDGEFGGSRPVEAMVEDAASGQRVLDELLGPAVWQRVFVPPNHLLSASFKERLPALGYRGVSGGLPLTAAVRGVMEVNAEIDVMDWATGQMLNESALTSLFVDQLRRRRLGGGLADSPVGLLTHHGVLEPPALKSLAEFICGLIWHPAVIVNRAETLFD